MTDYTSLKDEQFFGAIGRLTISWAYVELGLDWCLHKIHHELGGREKIEEQMPHALQRKIRYLRKAFNQLPELAAFRERFAKIADEIVTASEERHDIIHGFVFAHPEASGEALMARLIRTTEPHSLKAFPATTESVLRAAVRANKIYMLEFADEVIANLPSK